MFDRLTSSLIAALALLSFAPAQLEAKRPAPGRVTVTIDVDGEVTLNGKAAGTLRAGVPERMDVPELPAVLGVTANLGLHRAEFPITEADLRASVMHLDVASGLVSSLRSGKSEVNMEVPGGKVTTPPSLLRRVEPVYPPESRGTRAGAEVIIECLLSEDGRIQIRKFLSEPSAFDVAAARSVLQWRYRPALTDGKPRAVLMRQTIRFGVRGSEPPGGKGRGSK